MRHVISALGYFALRLTCLRILTSTIQKWFLPNSPLKYVISALCLLAITNARPTLSQTWPNALPMTNCWSCMVCTSKLQPATTTLQSQECLTWKASTSGNLGRTWRAPRKPMPNSSTLSSPMSWLLSTTRLFIRNCMFAVAVSVEKRLDHLFLFTWSC